jgi:tol-pal system protein YbgF
MKSKALTVLFIIVVLSGCALQRDVLTLDDRLILIERQYVELKKKSKKLESQLDAYSGAMDQKDQVLRNQSAGQHVIIDELRNEIATLNGRIEETNYLLKQKIKTLQGSHDKRENQLAKIDKITSLNKDRITHLEQYLNFETEETDSKIKAKSDTKPSGEFGGKLSEDGIYRLAKKAFDQDNLETAREGFQKIIKEYPKSRHADNAQFWIGEIYYREKWYEKAILEYQKVIEKYPKGNKVQSSLLKQGFAFYNIGDKANARLILKELIKKHPKSNEAKVAKQKLKGFTP